MSVCVVLCLKKLRHIRFVVVFHRCPFVSYTARTSTPSTRLLCCWSTVPGTGDVSGQPNQLRHPPDPTRYISNRRPPGMAVARLRCAAAIAVATATPAVAAPPLRRHSVSVLVPGAARLRLSFRRIPPPKGVSAAAMSSSARTEHEAGAWYAVPGLSLRDHRFAVPLDHSSPDSGAAITVFAREVVAGRSRLLALSNCCPPRLPASDPPYAAAFCVGLAVFAGCFCVGVFIWEVGTS